MTVMLMTRRQARSTQKLIFVIKRLNIIRDMGVVVNIFDLFEPASHVDVEIIVDKDA